MLIVSVFDFGNQESVKKHQTSYNTHTHTYEQRTLFLMEVARCIHIHIESPHTGSACSILRLLSEKFWVLFNLFFLACSSTHTYTQPSRHQKDDVLFPTIHPFIHSLICILFQLNFLPF